MNQDWPPADNKRADIEKQGSRMSADRKREWGLGAVLFALLAALAMMGVMEPVESAFLDWRFLMRGPRAYPEPIVIIGVDELSLDHPKSGPWPWGRENFAQLLFALEDAEAQPRVIGFNLLFKDEYIHQKEGDDSFAYRAEDFSGKVVTAFFFDKGYVSRFERSPAKEKRLKEFALTISGPGPSKLEDFDKVSLPYLDLARATDLGFSNIPASRGNGARKMRLIARYGGKVYPSFDLMMALRYWGVRPGDVTVEKNAIVFRDKWGNRRKIPVTDEGDLYVNIYGKAREGLVYHAFVPVMLADKTFGGRATLEMLESFRDRMVFVGPTAASLDRGFMTPYEQNVPAIFLHANAVANILEGSYLVRVPRYVNVIILFAVSILAILMVGSMRLMHAVLGLAAMGGGIFLVSYGFFLKGVWLDAAIHELAIVILFIGMLCFRYFSALEELRKAQSQIVHSTKMAMIGQISSGMAHEFRNILHAIKLHVEGCTRPGMSPERVRKYMTAIFRILENAELILTGILTFARKSGSTKRLENMKKTVENTLLLVKKELMYRKIQVKAQLDDVSPAEYDPGQMSQVILNLINNARDALGGNTVKLIMIRLKEDDRGIFLDIGDNGPGIPKEVMDHLFEPFVTTKSEGKGTGLGLSVCRDILKAQGGEITVTTFPGEGTVWHIFLPKG